jgi:DNA-directed RNA polymerase specialized sigma24 family protein
VDRKFEIALHTQLKNGALWRLIQSAGSVKAFARKIGVLHYSDWCQVVKLKKSVWRMKANRLEQLRKSMLENTGLLLEDVFPRFELHRTETTIYRSVDKHTLEAISKDLLPSPEDAMLECEEQERVQGYLDEAIASLDGRRAWVVKAHSAGSTFEEIAKDLGISRMRVHQIYQRGLQLIRIDMASKNLPARLRKLAMQQINCERRNAAGIWNEQYSRRKENQVRTSKISKRDRATS